MNFRLLSVVVPTCSGSLWFETHSSSGGRASETFTQEQLEGMNPILRRQLPNSNSEDILFDSSTPNITADGDQERMNSTLVAIGPLISQSYNSAVFSISDTRRIIYMHDCDREFNGLTHFPHPLFVAMAYTREAFLVHASIDRVVFVSPPAPLPLSRVSRKLAFLMTEMEYSICVFNGGTVRYAVLESSAENIISLNGLQARMTLLSRQTVSRSARIGVTLMKVLKNLHGKNLIHGNLNLRDTLLFQTGNRSMGLFLSNFEHATWIEHNSSPTVRSTDIGYIDFAELSPWELEEGWGHFRSARDEVFRAIQMVASLILGHEYLGQQRKMTREALIEWKKSGDVFSLPSGEDLLGSDQGSDLSDSEKILITTCFRNIQEIVRDNGEPYYGRIALIFDFLDKQFRKTGKYHPFSSTHSSWLVPRLESDHAPENVPSVDFIARKLAEPARRNQLVFVTNDLSPLRFITYFHDCDETGVTRSIHPAVSAFNIYTKLSKLKITSTPLWLSHAAPLPVHRTRKTNFTLSDAEYDTCVSANATVRYLVSTFSSLRHRSLRVPVANFARTNTFNFTEAMSVGATLVSILKEMHSLNITHGNLNRHQFTLHKVPRYDWALFSLHGFQSSSRHRSPSIWMSPWELTASETPSYTKRDDMHRVMEIVGTLLNGPIYETVFSRLSSDELVYFKRLGFVFGTPNIGGCGLAHLPIPSFPSDPRQSSIAYHFLDSILAHIRQTDPELINYDYLITLFQRLASMGQHAEQEHKQSNKRPRS